MTTERLQSITDIQEMVKAAEEALESLEDKLPTSGMSVNQASKLVTIYETRTGRPAKIPRALLNATLKKKHNDPEFPEWLGKPVFTLGKQDPTTGQWLPPKEYKLGEHKCLLHDSQPNYPEYVRRGWKACPAAHLASESEVVRHMETKHPSEWHQLLIEKAERERQEDRAAQKAMLQALAALLENAPTQPAASTSADSGTQAVGTPEAPLYVSDKTKVEEPKRRWPFNLTR